jgi:hypothetical protein
MFAGIKINLVNFIAFPITFGIGVDYAVNVMARYLRDGGRSVAAAVRGTGGAVALCSFTTIVGYSSLLVAKNVGLFLFGVLAVLGEVTCLVTAIIVLTSVLLVRPQSSSAAAGVRVGQADQRGPRGSSADVGAETDADVHPHARDRGKDLSCRRRGSVASRRGLTRSRFFSQVGLGRPSTEGEHLSMSGRIAPVVTMALAQPRARNRRIQTSRSR